MTDDQTGMPGGSESGEASDSGSPKPSVPSMDSIADSVSERFSSSEGMVAFGGGLIVAGWVLFEIILNDYYTAWVTLLLAVLAIMLPRASRVFVDKFAPMSALMKAVGYMIVILAAISLVEDIRFASSALDDFTEILGALVLYGGSAIAWLGARAIDA